MLMNVLMEYIDLILEISISKEILNMPFMYT